MAATTVSPADEWLLRALAGHVEQSALERVLNARHRGAGVWETVVASELISEDDLLQAASVHTGLPVADLSAVAAQALELVPERWARRFRILPVAADDSELTLATGNPYDMDCERTLAFASGRTIAMALASPAEILRRLDECYRGEGVVREPDPALDVQHLGVDQEAAPPNVTDDGASSVTALVDELLGAGIAARASDIHIEPEEQGIAVRHRVDGVLRLARRLPRAISPALVSRIKIISGLDIADRLRPQDGRARVAVNGTALDLRVSTLPASHGEKVVIRVLDGRASVLTLPGMGFDATELNRIQQLLTLREGLILVTGPTGSGKTTTLYAALRELKQRGVNIVTVEDPIEYRLPGIVQVQVNERAGLTFASALRSIMRQDPDVLLIGEIRDRETAEIAIQASLTGHLVLSTLHTNDAASAVTRLIDIGVASYKIATAVKGVLAQRLTRRLCEECSSDGTAHGCSACGDTGYHGRLAIVEIIFGSPEFERCVSEGATTERIADAGRAGGMRSLWESGLAQVSRGATTMEELRRVAAPPALSLSRADRTPPRRPVGSRDSAGPTGPSNARVDSRALRHYLTDGEIAPNPAAPELPLAQISIGTIDVYVIRPLASGWRVLALQRAVDTRCPTAWESVHGHIEPGEEPEDAAVRELREETGLPVARLYNVTVQPFYLHASHTVQVAVVFAAFVDEPANVITGPEHQRAEWLSVDQVLKRFHWPRERSALREIVELLGTGDAGPVEDVLRIL